MSVNTSFREILEPVLERLGVNETGDFETSYAGGFLKVTLNEGQFRSIKTKHYFLLNKAQDRFTKIKTDYTDRARRNTEIKKLLRRGVADRYVAEMFGLSIGWVNKIYKT